MSHYHLSHLTVATDVALGENIRLLGILKESNNATTLVSAFLGRNLRQDSTSNSMLIIITKK